jgi:hypothetical protein
VDIAHRKRTRSSSTTPFLVLLRVMPPDGAALPVAKQHAGRVSRPGVIRLPIAMADEAFEYSDAVLFR